MVIPDHLHDEANTQMLMIVDEKYRQIFEDTTIKRKVTPKWEMVGTKFQRYYQPRQVYGHLKNTIRRRVIDFMNSNRVLKDEALQFISVDEYHDVIWMEYSWDPIQQITDRYVIDEILEGLYNIDPLHKEIFIKAELEEQSYTDIALWLGLNFQKVAKIVKRVKEMMVAKVAAPCFNLTYKPDDDTR